MEMKDATLQQLAEELERSQVAEGIHRAARRYAKARRERQYRAAIMAEIDRRDPIANSAKSMTDAELLAELEL